MLNSEEDDNTNDLDVLERSFDELSLFGMFIFYNFYMFI